MLMFIDMPLSFIAPSFMKLDLSDVPALIGGFAMGPVYGAGIQLVKNLLNVTKTSTMGVGELSNFIVGSTFVITASIIYKRRHNLKGAMIGLFFGVLAMSTLACLSNYFVIFPLYGKIAIPMETIINMGRAINPQIDGLKAMILFSVLPFNLIKGSVNAIATLLLYKKISPILKN